MQTYYEYEIRLRLQMLLILGVILRTIMLSILHIYTRLLPADRSPAPARCSMTMMTKILLIVVFSFYCLWASGPNLQRNSQSQA